MVRRGRAEGRGGGGTSAYSIRVVASQTGIPAETLRVWERRYGFPKPARRPGGGRLYGDADVARLRLIARARDAGYRPGDVIALPDHDIARLVENEEGSAEAIARQAEAAAVTSPDVGLLVDDIRRDEIGRVRSSLRTLAITRRPKAFVTDIAHPLAVKIGDEWEAGTVEVRHEHLATALLSAQLRLLLSAFEDGEDAPVVLLATLPGEAHALGLEMIAVYLATHRATPRLLGADTPPDEIARAARSLGADVVGLSISGAHDATMTKRNVDQVRQALAGTSIELWIGGAGAEQVAAPTEHVRLTTSWSEVDAALESVRMRIAR